MDIRSTGLFSAGNKMWPSQLRPGQHLSVQVLRMGENGEGTILLEGEETPALLETVAKTGDRFGVTVREVADGTLLLVRDPTQAGAAATRSEHLPVTTERGVSGSGSLELEQVLRNFAVSSRPELLVLVQADNVRPVQPAGLLTTVAGLIPEWSELTSADLPEQLVRFFKGLGLDYEHRLKLISRLDDRFKDAEVTDLKNTLKAQILSLLSGAKDAGANPEFLTKLLRELTAQQLWYQTGVGETAYMLWQFMVGEQDRYYNVRAAVEGSRKGKKIDRLHCHVAVGLETPTLGEIGVDAWFNQDAVKLKVLSHDPEMLEPILDEVLPVTRAQLQKLGLNLGSVESSNLDDNFQRFLHGEKLPGVDIRT